MYCTGGRTDHTPETERRHEANPDMGNSRDVGGENHGTTVEPADSERWSPGDGSNGVECAAVVLV